MTDWQLLERYSTHSDEAAFAEIVARHLNVVYQRAKRDLGGPGAEAEDVAQAVFLLLAQKAKNMPRRRDLVGWLHQATKYCCRNVRKTAGRRRRHELEAGIMRYGENEFGDAGLLQLLDEALDALGTNERAAVLLRFAEGRTGEEAGWSWEFPRRRRTSARNAA